MDSPPIFRLVPELLLKIFTIIAQDPDAVLAFSVVCCKRWRPLAQLVLYSDVLLSGERLVKFAKKGGGSDDEIRSLTLHLGPVHVNQYDPQQAIETTEGWLNALRGLLPRINRMVQLESLSVSADFPLPYSPCGELSSIVEALPTTCVALEIDWRHSTFIQQKLGTAATATAHICDSIRTVLGRTQHLRLRLPKVCPGVFGEQDEDGFHPAGAPKLENCIINLSQRTPGTSPRASWAASCNSQHIPHIGSQTWIAPVLPSLVPKLQSFAQLNPTLKRLWVIDCQASGQGKNSWAAWIRRDVGCDASWPIPLVNVGGFRQNAWLARLPTIDPEASTEDKISSPETLEALVEDCAWSGDQAGVRLPTPILIARGYEPAHPPLRRRAQLRGEEDISCTLWENEALTGETLLSRGPGALMQVWDLNERTPSGWKRANFTGSSMVRLNG